MQIGVDSQRAVETKRAYIIDSDDVGATGLQFMLADELEVHQMAACADALSRASQAVDVILLGAEAAGAAGEAGLRALFGAFEGVPVIAYGPAGDERVAQALALGARSSIARPFKLETVRQKVNAQIGRRAVLTIPVVRG
ncbi:hypothetical protein AACH06_21410 [Ideonella sp. DXS29W]|uniref:Response regulatory domain-containing protein n=1 Tax=Ideonella lacteola TaxID=2984193 RepID=A0ABU9BTT6_9BURK